MNEAGSIEKGLDAMPSPFKSFDDVESPTIVLATLLDLGDVRRAKLYYLRKLHGKAAKIKERREDNRR